MVEIIAEIGSSWSGDYDILERMLDDLSEMGIKTVKFQAYGFDFIAKHGMDFPHIEKGRITPQNVMLVYSMCYARRLEFMCTPCYIGAVEFLYPYVKRWKIRLKDCYNITLLNECISHGQKPMLISTNDCHYDPILWHGYQLLFCIKKKPILSEEINFSDVDFNFFQGYSNHCPTSDAIYRAIKNGAKIIEIHVTPDHDLRLIDNQYSFDMGEMRTIMRNIQCLA